jgi:hypothetical protein
MSCHVINHISCHVILYVQICQFNCHLFVPCQLDIRSNYEVSHQVAWWHAMSGLCVLSVNWTPASRICEREIYGFPKVSVPDGEKILVLLRFWGPNNHLTNIWETFHYIICWGIHWIPVPGWVGFFPLDSSHWFV